MKQVHVKTSNYSVDLFGICSALYELGGLIVMHDASGCNSTYATHDEPRWYDIDSMIYISALSEYDAVLGNDEKYINDVLEVAMEKKPKFITVFGSPVALMMGTDFRGIAHIIEKRSGIPTIWFKTTGMHDYRKGISMAFEKIAERFCLPTEHLKYEISTLEIKPRLKINVLGVTPLDFSHSENVKGFYEFAEKYDFEIQSCWAMGSSFEDLAKAGEADVNLVVTESGIRAAEVLKEKYGMPYVVGIPIGDELSKIVADMLRHSFEKMENQSLEFQQNAVSESAKKVIIVSEIVIAKSLASAIILNHGDYKIEAFCPISDFDEEQISEKIKDADVCIADPLFKRLGEPKFKFINFPHEACSGRLFRNEIPKFVGPFADLGEHFNNV